jgi:hypothetical protein
VLTCKAREAELQALCSAGTRAEEARDTFACSRGNENPGFRVKKIKVPFSERLRRKKLSLLQGDRKANLNALSPCVPT